MPGVQDRAARGTPKGRPVHVTVTVIGLRLFRRRRGGAQAWGRPPRRLIDDREKVAVEEAGAHCIFAIAYAEPAVGILPFVVAFFAFSRPTVPTRTRGSSL